MFSKDNSSIQSASSGKKGKDVPLRKSDRRHLRERVRQTLLLGLQPQQPQPQPQQDDDDNNNNNNSDTVLDTIFLQGTLLSRNLHLANQERAVLYVRNPDKDNHDNDNDTAALWPYTASPQVVWMEIDHGPHQTPSQVPTLALLSVLSSSATAGIIRVTVPPQVSKFLCRGAHLMKSGVAQVVRPPVNDDSSTNSNNNLAIIQITGNPQPLAVGWLDPSVQTMADVGPGTKGTAVHVVTAYGDDLWKQQLPTASASDDGPMSPLGAPYNAGHYGNIGFCEGKYAVPLVMEEEQQEDQDDDDDDESVEQVDPNGQEEPPLVQDTTVRTNKADLSSTNDKESPDSPPTAGSPSEEPKDTPPPPPPSSSPSPEQVLHQAVCRALVRLNVKTDLPMAVSVFYAQHVLPNRPPGTTVQLKQTKYKKFGPYLQEQVERGLLQVGPDAVKKDPMAMLTSFDRRHVDLRDHVPQARQEKADQAAASSSKTRLVLLDLFVIPAHWVALLRLDPDAVKAATATSQERRNTGYLTAKETKAILEDYIARENLVHPVQQSKIVLDGPLNDALYKQKKSKHPDNTASTAIPTEVTRKDLATTWQAKMERAFALVQMPGSRILHMGRGKGPVVTMEVSKRQNKKFVTKIRGFEHFDIDASELQQEIARRFACAASVEENPHEKLKKGHVELVLQGNLADEVEALLIGDESLTSHGGAKDSPYSIPKNAVEVVLRKGVPARKGRGAAGKK